MRQSDLGALDLVLVIATELFADLVDLSDTGRADRVALREQPPARIDRNLSVDLGPALGDRFRTLAFLEETEILRVTDLRRRETVVQFDDVDVVGTDPGLFVGRLGGVCGRLERRQVFVPVGGVRPVVWPLPSTRIGSSVSSEATSEAARTTAAPPSAAGQQS